jgi:hypothetical protein
MYMYRKFMYRKTLFVLGAVSLSLLSSMPKALSRPGGGGGAPTPHVAAAPQMHAAPQVHATPMAAPHAMAPEAPPHFAAMPAARPMPMPHPVQMPAAHPMQAMRPMSVSHATSMPTAHIMQLPHATPMPTAHAMQMPHSMPIQTAHFNQPKMQYPAHVLMPHSAPTNVAHMPSAHMQAPHVANRMEDPQALHNQAKPAQLQAHRGGMNSAHLQPGRGELPQTHVAPHETEVERSAILHNPRGLAMAGGLAGAAGIAGYAAQGMMKHGQSEPHQNQMLMHENGAHAAMMPELGRGGGRTQERAGVPAASMFANPRPVGEVRPGASGFKSVREGAPLSYAHGASDIPRVGNRMLGRQGAIDPGGYLRAPHAPSGLINPRFARQQFAAVMPSYQAIANFNNRHLIADRGSWPWQLPAYAPGWFNGYGPNAWSWPQPNLGWANGFGMFGGLASLCPWGINNNLPWIPDMNYYNGYYWNNQDYPCDYFATNGFCPTPYVFNVGQGQFWQPGGGYFDSLPYGYQAPITVAVQEVVPSYDQNGQIIGFQKENFYYNAFWDPNAQAYGYYDYQQQFHWVTFPWLNSWNAQPPTNTAIY